MSEGVHFESDFNFPGWDNNMDLGLLMYGKAAAAKFEAHAKETAPWTDRTGDARKRLNADFTKEGNSFVLTVSQGVDYGVYLEMAHECKYAVLMPTIMNLKDDFLQALQTMLKGRG